MAIHLNEKTKVLVQGFTGQVGSFHAGNMIKYGTNVVGGVTPGKGSTKHLDKPVFNTMKEAVEVTDADASIVFVPPPFAADSIMEAADAGVRYCVAITDGIPLQDMIRVKRYMRRYKADSKMLLTGPDCAGSISPGKCMMGIMPGHIYLSGNVGIIGRSGTLVYEVVSQMKDMRIGVSSSIGIGGDPINGSSFQDHLSAFEEDSETDVVVIIGEIGGSQEVDAVMWARDNMSKPVIGYVAGLTAPKGRRMGHAGAVISTVGDSAVEKLEIFQECGVTVVPNPSLFASTIKEVLAKLS
ncbi:MAG: succinate--CoA ligase subunit alpha [Legionellales bacterium]|nr:succinate--CoA ligase subunit alpha [Legionellales bacterium]|tara:strand:- start:3427 stop:4317 length:891 start_codon:yes stop_codon:yes gene_type:complete